MLEFIFRNKTKSHAQLNLKETLMVRIFILT